MTLQYIILTLLFIAAVLYLCLKVIAPLFNKKNNTCDKGCGCGGSEPNERKLFH